ncbi:MAG: AI-2E family transporter [Planctomycetes bacterium]|nr:AI-2E family transporter [Planctomycetota bacterium]
MAGASSPGTPGVHTPSATNALGPGDPSRAPDPTAPTASKATDQIKKPAPLPRPFAALGADYGQLLKMRNVRVLIAFACVVIALIFGFYLSEIFVPLLFALGVAYVLNPLVDGLEKKGLTRARAVLFVFAGFVAVSLAFGSWFVTSIVSDVRQIGSQIGDVINDVREHQKEWVAGWNQNAPGFMRISEDVEFDSVLEVVKDKVAPQRTAVGSPEEKQAAAALAGVKVQYLGQLQALDTNHDLELTEGELSASAIKLADVDKNEKVSIDEWYLLHRVPGDNAGERTIAPEARAVAEGVFGFVSKGLLWTLGLVLFITLVPIYTWYFMIGLDDMSEKIEAWLPGRHRERSMRILREIDGMAKAFFRGRLLVVLIISVLSTILFMAFGVKYAFLLGLMSGLGVLIPYFSFVAGWLPALLLMSIAPNVNWVSIGGMSAIFFVIQAFEQYFLTPRLLGNAVELHPVTLLVGVFVMSALFGFFGALLAVPLTAIAKTLGREFVLPYFKALADEKPPPATS